MNSWDLGNTVSCSAYLLVMESWQGCRDAEPEPEPEPPEPTHFGRSRSRSRRNGLLGAGAVKNGAAPAPKRDTIVAKKQRSNKKKPNKQLAETCHP